MSQPTTILAFDCATGPCSAALWRDGKILAHRSEGAATRQAARLVPMIEEVLSESNIAYADLSMIATTTGPGSFTGIRIALATARAIALATRLPLAGFTTLEVMAFAAGEEAGDLPVLAALNAGRGEIYAQLFRGGEPSVPLREASAGPAEAMVAPLADRPLAVVGNVEPILRPLLPHARFLSPTHPEARDLAALAASRPLPENTALSPFYIRPPDAKLPSFNLFGV